LIFSDILNEISKDERFEISINITKSNDEKTPLNINTDDSNNLTLEYGRADYAKLFFKIHDLFNSEHIGVYACGPDLMMDSIHSHSHKYFNFHLHRETFYF
jgi:hypothetical protein